MNGRGIVYIVGAGPGDPGLITVRGRDCLRLAEVVIYDRLVNPALLAEAPAAAELIYVGKAPHLGLASQEEIDALLVAKAKTGRVVVRLKGGDPFVFGRGAEEALSCADAGVDWEVVPGLSSATSVPLLAGIPLTHRGIASSFTVATGTCAGASHQDWTALARAETLVVLMGIGHVAEITTRLLAAGRPPQTPAAILVSGSLPEERFLTGTLAALPELAAREGVRPPGILVIGEVVRLRSALQSVPTTRTPELAEAAAVSGPRAASGSEEVVLGRHPLEPPASSPTG